MRYTALPAKADQKLPRPETSPKTHETIIKTTSWTTTICFMTLLDLSAYKGSRNIIKNTASVKQYVNLCQTACCFSLPTIFNCTTNYMLLHLIRPDFLLHLLQRPSESIQTAFSKSNLLVYAQAFQ